MALLQIIDLNKSYNKQRVLTNLSLELHPGEIMGLIGQNGSGKTTIFKSILGLVKIDSGRILVNQELIDAKSRKYLNNIGTIIEYPTFYESLTAIQNLQLFSSLYDGNQLSKEDIIQSLGLVGLENDGNSKVESFSLGMKQRLGLAQALVHGPNILLLDEPFNGLDPKGVKELRELLSHLSQDGVGIIVSSHSLEELNKLVDTVTVIEQGELVFQGKKTEFLALGNQKNDWFLKTDAPELTRYILERLDIAYAEQDEQFELYLPMKEGIREKLLSELLEHKISIQNFSEKQENFEDIFLNIQATMEVEDDFVTKD